jgi:N-alpha-acetyltransferase 15/16, NatA auxiliary subunit
MFRKGVPSLFISLKDLYTNTIKRSTLESLVLGYASALESHSVFSTDDLNGDSDDTTLREPPSAFLWVLYYLAQHFDYLGETSRALEYINKAIDHTPTLVELLMTKARILKVNASAFCLFRKRILNNFI